MTLLRDPAGMKGMDAVLRSDQDPIAQLFGNLVKLR